jgi:hypothetical protein
LVPNVENDRTLDPVTIMLVEVDKVVYVLDVLRRRFEVHLGRLRRIKLRFLHSFLRFGKLTRNSKLFI